MTQSLNEQLVGQMNEALQSKDVEYWAARSETELSAARKACEAHWSTGLAQLSKNSGSLYLIGPVVGLLMGGPIFLPLHVIYFLVLALFPVAFVLVNPDSIELNKWNLILRMLCPLKDTPEACREALELVEKHACVKEYRDQVLAQGRQLRVVDLRMMQFLADAEQTKEDEQANATACQKLHGLDASTNLG